MAVHESSGMLYVYFCCTGEYCLIFWLIITTLLYECWVLGVVAGCLSVRLGASHSVTAAVLEQHRLGRSAADSCEVSGVCVVFLSTEDILLFLWKAQTVPADSDQPCAGEPCRADSGSLHPSGTVNSCLSILGCLYTILELDYFISHSKWSALFCYFVIMSFV